MNRLNTETRHTRKLQTSVEAAEPEKFFLKFWRSSKHSVKNSGSESAPKSKRFVAGETSHPLKKIARIRRHLIRVIIKIR